MLSSYIVICYLEGIAHLFLGNNTAHVIATAQANQLALALRLNEEIASCAKDYANGRVTKGSSR